MNGMNERQRNAVSHFLWHCLKMHRGAFCLRLDYGFVTILLLK